MLEAMGLIVNFVQVTEYELVELEMSGGFCRHGGHDVGGGFGEDGCVCGTIEEGEGTGCRFRKSGGMRGVRWGLNIVHHQEILTRNNALVVSKALLDIFYLLVHIYIHYYFIF